MFREVTMIELKEVLRLWGKGLLWLANSQSCRKDARTNSRAVIRAGTAGPESVLRIPRWALRHGAHGAARSVDTHRALRSCWAPAARTHPHAAIGV
jgi:hypothetical protein